jgi:hypothetical protein
MTLDEVIKRFNNNAEYEHSNGNLQECLEFKQLAEWLKDYKQLKEQELCEECVSKTEAINTIHKIIYNFFDVVDDDSEEPINDKDELLLTVNKALSKAIKDLHPVMSQPKIGK